MSFSVLLGVALVASSAPVTAAVDINPLKILVIGDSYMAGNGARAAAAPGVTVVDAGRTLPVTRSISDLDGDPVDDPASFVDLTYQLGDGATGVAEAPVSAPSTSGLGANGTGRGRWHLDWATPCDAAGWCAVVELLLDDGAITPEQRLEVRFTQPCVGASSAHRCRRGARGRTGRPVLGS